MKDQSFEALAAIVTGRTPRLDLQIHPSKQPDHRCPGCGRVWARTTAGEAVKFPPAGGWWDAHAWEEPQLPDEDGLFICCETRFGWEKEST